MQRVKQRAIESLQIPARLQGVDGARQVDPQRTAEADRLTAEHHVLG